jgi:excisionase family DNA binding protein
MTIQLRTRGAECRDHSALPSPDTSVQNTSATQANDADAQDDETSPAPPFLSLKEAADWLCVSLSTLKRLIAKGEISSIRIGARQKVPASHLAAYVARDIMLPSEVVVDTTPSDHE